MHASVIPECAHPMPELPEVETICRGLALVLDGQILRRLELRRPDLRFPFPPGLVGRVEGRRILRVGRRAKYIMMHFEDGGVVIAHPGMSGRIVIDRGAAPVPALHDDVVFETAAGTTIRLNDERRFGFIDYTTEDVLERHPLFAHPGPEPLSN